MDCCLNKKCVYCMCVCVSEKALGMQPSYLILDTHYVRVCTCVFVCVCVCIPLSLPQMMTLSAACPSNASAEAAGTVW